MPPRHGQQGQHHDKAELQYTQQTVNLTLLMPASLLCNARIVCVLSRSVCLIGYQVIWAALLLWRHLTYLVR